MDKKLILSLIGSGMIGAGLGAGVALNIFAKKMRDKIDLSEVIDDLNEVIDLAKQTVVEK